jgi:hypothetical protein
MDALIRSQYRLQVEVPPPPPEDPQPVTPPERNPVPPLEKPTPSTPIPRPDPPPHASRILIPMEGADLGLARCNAPEDYLGP